MNKQCEVCVMHTENRDCSILRESAKENEECAFFKTPEQAEFDRDKAFARIKSLPFSKRKHIMMKYYHKEINIYDR